VSGHASSLSTDSLSAELSSARYDITLFLNAGDFELLEDDRTLGRVDSENAAIELSWGKLIFSSWSEGWSRSWRVLSCSREGAVLRVACTKQMGRTACTLTLRRASGEAEQARTRRDFASSLSRLIEDQIPGVRVERADVGRLDQRYLRGIHTRLVLRNKGETVAGIGIGEGETSHGINSALAAGTVWLADLKRKKKDVNRLMIFVPEGRAETLATRLCAFSPSEVRISLFEVSEARRSIAPVAGFDQGDLVDRLRRVSHRSGRRPQWPRERRVDPEAQALINGLTLLAPDQIDTHLRGSWVLLSIRGLEFARVSLSRHRAEFGAGGLMTRLTAHNRRELAELVDRIVVERTSQSPRRGELLFRAQAERWLESAILRDVTAIDATLDPRFVYSQVPAYRGDERSYIDLLAATRGGRLVVIELKVSEDPDFPLQGLDYWLRVEWHRHRRDFARRGYFKGLDLDHRPPLLYLVAPLFRFHAMTDVIARCISTDVPAFRIGINEDWRNGIKVLLHERLNVAQSKGRR
jgi:hypothetical protein